MIGGSAELPSAQRRKKWKAKTKLSESIQFKRPLLGLVTQVTVDSFGADKKMNVSFIHETQHTFSHHRQRNGTKRHTAFTQNSQCLP